METAEARESKRLTKIGSEQRGGLKLMQITLGNERICEVCGEPSEREIVLGAGVTRWMLLPCACRRARDEERAKKNREEAEARISAGRVALVAKIQKQTPPAYQDVPLDAKLQQFADSFNGSRWLILRGAVGTGKTTQGYALVKYLANAGKLDAEIGDYRRRFECWNVARWLSAARAAFSGNGEVPDLEEPFLLFLDDLGAERIKRDSDGDSWAREQLYLVLNTRWEWRRPTIITTNLSAKRVEEHFLDERIADRIFDTSLTTIVTLTGESFRRKR